MFRAKNPVTIKNVGPNRLKALSHVGSVSPHQTQPMYRAQRPQYTEQASHSITTQYFSGQQMTTLFTGLYPDAEESMYRFYKDIYSFDSAAGSAVDLISSLPFSDWSLSGANAKTLDKYQASIERLNLRVMLPEIAIDYLIMGAFIGTLVFKESDGVFTDMIPHAKDHCTIKAMPFYGVDPVIEVSMDDTVRNFLQSKEKRIIGHREKLNPRLLKLLREKKFTLDPVTTLFLPRKTFTSNTGTSYYRRVLPLYFMEKVMWKGMMVEVAKRQRAFLHVQMGDELWEPTPEDMQAMASLFMQADLDPAGAIVVTRQSVNPSELRQGGDFYKWTDLLEQTTPLKMRALGISDTFLSSESTYANAEMSLSVFIENLNAFRNLVTLKIFYNRLFPIISIINGFKKEDSQVIGPNPDRPGTEQMAAVDEDNVSKLSKEDILYRMADTSQLVIPKLNWHKNLHPKNDQTYLETLNTLKEQGIPVPLRMWATAGGMTMESIINDLEDDELLVKKMMKYKRAQDALAAGEEGEGEFGDEGDGDDGGGGFDEGGNEEERTDDFGKGNKPGFSGSSVELARLSRGIKKKNWLKRDYSAVNEILGRSKTGKKKYMHNQKAAQNKANEDIAKAMHNLSDRHHYNTVVNNVKQRLGKIPRAY